jgi:molecular chaperone DnaK (HSP70)
VTFRVDTNGILRVRARDAATGAAREAAVNVRGGMSDSEVAEAVERQKSLEAPLDPALLPEIEI